MIKKPAPQPITVEATLLWIRPDRLVAMDAKGYFYTWEPKPAKIQGFLANEGDLVFVHADEITRDVFHITPQGSGEPQEQRVEGVT